MHTPVKIGLAGAGYLGLRHLKHLKEIPGVEVSGVWENSPEAIAKAAAEFNVPAARNFNDLIARSDAIDLVTPTSVHHSMGLAVIPAGKPLFVEKPICATSADGEDLVRHAEAGRVPLQIGHIERFNRAFRALSGIKIKPRFIEAHRLSTWSPRGLDVAVVHDLMVHDLDLVLMIAGEEPSAIHASGVGVITDSADIASARLEFPGGLVANLTASRISLKRMRKLRLFGQREYIALDLDKGSCEVVAGTIGGMPLPQGAETLGDITHKGRRISLYRTFLAAPEGDALRLELESFRDLIINGGEAVVSGKQALQALKLAERVVAAAGRKG